MQYIYSKEYLESQADKINKKYYPKRLEDAMPFDVYDFLDKQGFDVEWKYISPNKELQGLFFFEEGDFYIWPSGNFKKGDIPVKEHFGRNTVVINQAILDSKDFRKEVFVANHEICHGIKDRSYFMTYGKTPLQMCTENDVNRTYWNESMSLTDIIERQTNYLNAAILMPRDVIKKEFFKILRFKNIPNEPIKLCNYMKSAIRKLADIFGVNFNPVLYRLYDLNILIRE